MTRVESKIDCVYVNANSASIMYQSLASNLSAVEPPTWALLLAKASISKGMEVAIIDANAEALTDEEVLVRVKTLNPRVICFVVYGQNVNAGTSSMSGATRTSKYLKESGLLVPHLFIGSHMQALPKQTMDLELSIDFICTNEGVYSHIEMLGAHCLRSHCLESIRGIAWRDENEKIRINPPGIVVPTEKMDEDLPGYAWELLPYRETPLDLYRSPLWHAQYDQSKRSPYAAIQTSLGCLFSCSFCMINLINRNDSEEVGVAGNYSRMRFWSPSFMLKQFDILVELGVRTIRIVDEMFLLNRKYYVPLCEGLANKDYSDQLLLWAYSRVDTVSSIELLKLIRRAGIRWLCLGIESAERKIRLEVSKGKFQDVDIRKVISQVHDADIDVLANYIVGLPGENLDSMQNTLDFSIELGTSGWNMYPAMALPGSQLYSDAVNNGLPLPDSYAGFSWHGYETLPLSNGILSSEEILAFRDQAFNKYHESEKFRHRVLDRFGHKALEEIDKMSTIQLKRKILEV